MEWSLSKVIRIENGDVRISADDVRLPAAYLGSGTGAGTADGRHREHRVRLAFDQW